ncbi:MAG: SGNH/GDSL hydrolase family protein, partial [Clostridia bacterium]|nr:SGNH/GDSL hydrolase family protein [Clostridia bacterium]
MKKIVLIGDSIRMGYDKYVKEALDGVAEVYYPAENCRFSQYTLRFLHDWKKKGEWPDDVDLVHWNVGLWDVIELYDEGPISSPEHYAEMLRRINKRIRMLFPKAKVVFAT